VNDSKLHGFYRGLEALYETSTGLDPHTVLMPYHRAQQSTPRELLLLRETEDGELEVGLAIDHAVLRKLEDGSVDEALGDEGLGDTLPVLCAATSCSCCSTSGPRSSAGPVGSGAGCDGRPRG
jgi:hypothetical protein